MRLPEPVWANLGRIGSQAPGARSRAAGRGRQQGPTRGRQTQITRILPRGENSAVHADGLMSGAPCPAPAPAAPLRCSALRRRGRVRKRATCFVGDSARVRNRCFGRVRRFTTRVERRGSGDLPLRGIRFGQARRSTGRAACRRSVRGGAHGPTASRAAGVDYRPGPAGANHARPGHGTSRSISASRGRETIAVERNTRPSASAPILGPLQERVFKGRGPRRAPGPARTGTRPRRASGRQRLAGARRTPRRTPALLVAAENPTRPAASNPPIVRSCVGRSPLPARPGSFSRLPRRRPGHPFSDLPAGPGETLLGWQEMYHVFKKRGRGLVLSGVLVVVWIALVRVVVQVVFVASS